jgi:hypothetical protein
MDPIFHRPKLALDMAKLLLRPSTLETRIRSGLFISGPRQTGKSTLLTQDVIPTLEAAGAIVIYVDLWKAEGKTPAGGSLSFRGKTLSPSRRKPQPSCARSAFPLPKSKLQSNRLFT